MADPIINQAYSFWITGLQDLSGNVLTGATWNTTLSRKPDGTTVFTPTITESEAVPGDYLVTQAPDVAGIWVFRGTPNGIDLLRINYAFEVQPATATANPTASAIATAVLAASVSGYDAVTVGAQLARISQIGTGTITVTNPVAQDQTLSLVRGDAYDGDQALSWADNGWIIPNGADITLSATYAGQMVTFAGTRISATVVSIDLSALDTAALVPGRAHYRYRITANDDILVTGAMSVTLG